MYGRVRRMLRSLAARRVIGPDYPKAAGVSLQSLESVHSWPRRTPAKRSDCGIGPIEKATSTLLESCGGIGERGRTGERGFDPRLQRKATPHTFTSTTGQGCMNADETLGVGRRRDAHRIPRLLP